MRNYEKKPPIEELVENIINTRFENIDEVTSENAKLKIMDVLGCVINGAKAAGNSELMELVKGWGGIEEATILVWGGRVPAHNAAMVNSVMARSYDFEPVNTLVDGKEIPNHLSGTTVITALSAGEMKGVNGKELISALVAGDDTAARVLAASGFDFNLGWDNTGTINMIGATAVAGRLLGLNKLQMRNAFGLVLNQMAGSFQSIYDATTAFKLPQGLSARNGIFSSQLAKAGWIGPEDALLSSFGYYHLYTNGCKNPEILTKDLGKKYYNQATFKPYPCCRGSHSAIECALAIVRRNEIKAEDIEEIILYAPKMDLELFLGQPFQIKGFPHASAAFNFQYIVANVLLRKSIKPEHFSKEAIRDHRINTLIRKIRLSEIKEAPGVNAKLEVKLQNGKILSEYNDIPQGEPLKKPLLIGDIKTKFLANVDFSQTLKRVNAEKALDLLENLEEIDCVNRIVELLVA
jgi:2-methylcitrate dehydratase PrpD